MSNSELRRRAGIESAKLHLRRPGWNQPGEGGGVGWKMSRSATRARRTACSSIGNQQQPPKSPLVLLLRRELPISLSEMLLIGLSPHIYMPAFFVADSIVLSLILGAWNSCALLRGGVLKCWGQNIVSQLGAGQNSNLYLPVAADFGQGAILFIAGVRAI